MATDEVYANPTVKKVVFQLRYPTLFFLESKVGDFQLRVMKEFPDSSLVFRRQVVYAEVGPETKLEELPAVQDQSSPQIWAFKSPGKYGMNLRLDSLDISSDVHKTYAQETSEDNFRTIITKVLDAFTAVAAIPFFTRVGLRYIDECPLPPSLTTAAFLEYYNTILPVDRFPVENGKRMDSIILSSPGAGMSLRYAEALWLDTDPQRFTLDFDASASDVPATDCLAVTDKLHDVVSNAFKESIKEPVREHMRQEQKA